MKYFNVFCAAFMLLAASCSNDESLDSGVNTSNEQAVAPVTVPEKAILFKIVIRKNKVSANSAILACFRNKS